MARPKRYEEYPQLARLVRAMTPEGRDLVAHWHRVLMTALEGYIPHAKNEVKQTWDTVGLQNAAKEGAETALQAWLGTMRKVAATVVDPAEGDWCCKLGMMTAPSPCPQHGFHPGQDYPLGTTLERVYGEGRERAVKVYDNSEDPHPWRSVEFPLSYKDKDLVGGEWRVVGHV